MSMQAVVSGHCLDDVLVWRPQGGVTVRQFLAHAQTLASRLPAGQWLLNMCDDRYHFAVGFVAGLLAGKTSLQPSSQSAETLQRIAQDYPGVVCLSDGFEGPGQMSCVHFPDLTALDGPLPDAIPELPSHRLAAVLFTSGSTGLPQAHQRTLAHLVSSALSEAEALGLSGHPHAIVGTVPAQHSFGFESTFLLALHGGCSFWSGKPFYPQDIVQDLQAVTQPRLLVTTPFHLYALVSSGLSIPPLRMVLSATAPLSAELAERAEAITGAPVHEIYGSTESSALASRRTTDGPSWTLLPGVVLEQEAEITYADQGHVPSRIALSDVIELRPNRQLLLHGRHADMVNIAGKRTSLAYLNHQIARVAGVKDAVFFLPDDESSDRISRLCAFVVAPEMTRDHLMVALRNLIDPVFLPRPLVLLNSLPRNHLGKLPRAQLQALYREKVNSVRS